MVTKSETIWSVSDANGRLYEVLRPAREKGPQYIGKRGTCVVVPRAEWEAKVSPQEDLTTWLLKHSPHVDLEHPARGASSGRSLPFQND